MKTYEPPLIILHLYWVLLLQPVLHCQSGTDLCQNFTDCPCLGGRKIKHKQIVYKKHLSYDFLTELLCSCMYRYNMFVSKQIPFHFFYGKREKNFLSTLSVYIELSDFPFSLLIFLVRKLSELAEEKLKYSRTRISESLNKWIKRCRSGFTFSQVGQFAKTQSDPHIRVLLHCHSEQDFGGSDREKDSIFFFFFNGKCFPLPSANDWAVLAFF